MKNIKVRKNNLMCRYCNDTNFRNWRYLGLTEKEKVRFILCHSKSLLQLDNEKQLIVIKKYCDTEDRNESEKLNPSPLDVIDYYEDNAENFHFFGKEEIIVYYNNDRAKFKFICKKCIK